MVNILNPLREKDVQNSNSQVVGRTLPSQAEINKSLSSSFWGSWQPSSCMLIYNSLLTEVEYNWLRSQVTLTLINTFLCYIPMTPIPSGGTVWNFLEWHHQQANLNYSFTLNSLTLQILGVVYHVLIFSHYHVWCALKDTVL